MNPIKRFARYVLSTELRVLQSTIVKQESDIEFLSRHHSHLSDELAEATARFQTRPVEKIYGLSKEVFENRVVQKLENPLITASSNTEYASYLLGIQRALRVMEKEVVHK